MGIFSHILAGGAAGGFKAYGEVADERIKGKAEAEKLKTEDRNARGLLNIKQGWEDSGMRTAKGRSLSNEEWGGLSQEERDKAISSVEYEAKVKQEYPALKGGAGGKSGSTFPAATQEKLMDLADAAAREMLEIGFWDSKIKGKRDPTEIEIGNKRMEIYNGWISGASPGSSGGAAGTLSDSARAILDATTKSQEPAEAGQAIPAIDQPGKQEPSANAEDYGQQRFKIPERPSSGGIVQRELPQREPVGAIFEGKTRPKQPSAHEMASGFSAMASDILSGISSAATKVKKVATEKTLAEKKMTPEVRQLSWDLKDKLGWPQEDIDALLNEYDYDVDRIYELISNMP